MGKEAFAKGLSRTKRSHAFAHLVAERKKERESVAEMICIDDRDPLAILLVRVFRLSTKKVVLLMLLCYSFVEGILFLWLDWMPQTPRDWPWLVSQYLWLFVEIPIIYGYYRWSIDDIPRMFTTLGSNGVIRKARRGQETAFFDQLRQSFNHPVWVVLSVAVAVSLSVLVNSFWLLLPVPIPLLQARNRYRWLFAQVVMLANGYVGTMITLRELLTIEWIRRFFRDFDIRILPKPLLRAGGFGVIGHHYLHLTYFVVAIGMGFGITLPFSVLMGQELPYGLPADKLFLAYLPIATIVFVLPSWIAHRSMAAEKERVLEHISSAYEGQLRRLSDGIGSTASDINQGAGAIQRWRDAEDLTMTYLPTWPWELRVVAQVISSIVSGAPIALGIASIILRITMAK